MTKCTRDGCNNEAQEDRQYCGGQCGAIVMGERMQRIAEEAGFGYFIMRPKKPEGEPE